MYASYRYPDLTQGEILRHRALTRPIPQDDGVLIEVPQDNGSTRGQAVEESQTEKPGFTLSTTQPLNHST